MDLNPATRRGRPRDRYGRATRSSDILMRRDNDRSSADDIKTIKEKLLRQAHSRKVISIFCVSVCLFLGFALDVPGTLIVILCSYLDVMFEFFT